MARVMYEYYKATGHIPCDFLQSLQPAPSRKKTKAECAAALTGSNIHDIKKPAMIKTPEKIPLGRSNHVLFDVNPPATRNASFKPFLSKNMAQESESRTPTPISNTASSSSSSTSSRLASNSTPVPSLSVIDFNSLTMSRKDLHQVPRRNPSSL